MSLSDPASDKAEIHSITNLKRTATTQLLFIMKTEIDEYQDTAAFDFIKMRNIYNA